MGAGTRGGNPRAKRVYKRKPAWQKRKFQKKKPMYKPRKPIAMGVETYQFRLAAQSTTLTANVASADNGPKNSLICLPAGFSSATTCVDSNGDSYTVQGNFIKPVYQYSMKCKVDFSGIVHHADNAAGLNLRCHHGLVKVTANSETVAGWSNQASFQAAILALIKEHLYESSISSDYLEYSKRNRHIKVNGSFDVVPDRRRMIRMDMLETAGTGKLNSVNTPPPKCFTVTLPTPKMKTRVAKTADSAKFPILENLWIPWVLFTCDQLTSNSGHFNVHYSSRMYFTDV